MILNEYNKMQKESIDEYGEKEEIEENVNKDEETRLHLCESIFHLLYDYINENPTSIAEPDFHETMMDDMNEILDVQFEDLLEKHKSELFFSPIHSSKRQEIERMEEFIEETLDEVVDIFYQNIMPPRSHPGTFIKNILKEKDIERISQQIQYLRNKYQPAQRTPEWYETRHRLITASNAYKAFESQSQKNQLIYEKCQPIKMDNSAVQVNVNTPFHWGQKYEPVSVKFYEKLFKTVIGDFGCIQHDTYLFIGASPDGINVDPLSPRFGRLLEIKNIVNREIDGIPKKEYWIQMQLQMETCNLDECDFLETRFVEYKDDDEDSTNTLHLTASNKFLMDGTFDKTAKEEYKGIILYFAKTNGNPHYEYMPFEIDTYAKFVYWEHETIEKCQQQELTWIKNLYWRLEEISCVLVERNYLWFKNNIEGLASLWNIVEKERETGYEHRAPQKKKQTSNLIDIQSNPFEKCLIQINKATGEVTLT